MGHSLVVVEHNSLMMQAADFIIDLGPGAADAGGSVVAYGTPEEIATSAKSATGQFSRRGATPTRRNSRRIITHTEKENYHGGTESTESLESIAKEIWCCIN